MSNFKSGHMWRNFWKPLCIKFKWYFGTKAVYGNIENQIRSLENLNVKSDMHGPLLIPVLQSKIPNEWNLIISGRFNDLLERYWSFKVFREELIAREKLFLSEPNADLFTASSLLAGTEKSKKKP